MNEQHAVDAAIIESALLDAVDMLREHWADLLEPVVGPRSGTPSADTLTALERRIGLRQDVDRLLAKWCRVIIRDRHLTRGGLRTDALGMLDLIERHAEWFADHDDAERASSQLGAAAREVRATAEPAGREFVDLGPCPFVLTLGQLELDDPGGWPPNWPGLAGVACGGRVRASLADPDTAACTVCDQSAVVEWWEEVLGIRLPWCTLPGLIPVLHARLGMRVTERTLRNWRRDGKITPALRPEDHDPHGGIGPRLVWDLFDPLDVVADVADMDRACVLCGRPWDGGGDVCRACWASTSRTFPKIAELRPAYAVVSRPRALVVAVPGPPVGPTHPDCRHQSCARIARRLCPTWELPIEQCGCGRHDASA